MIGYKVVGGGDMTEYCSRCNYPVTHGDSCLRCEARSSRRWMILALVMGILALGISVARLLWDLVP